MFDSYMKFLFICYMNKIRMLFLTLDDLMILEKIVGWLYGKFVGLLHDHQKYCRMTLMTQWKNLLDYFMTVENVVGWPLWPYPMEKFVGLLNDRWKYCGMTFMTIQDWDAMTLNEYACLAYLNANENQEALSTTEKIVGWSMTLENIVWWLIDLGWNRGMTLENIVKWFYDPRRYCRIILWHKQFVGWTIWCYFYIFECICYTNKVRILYLAIDSLMIFEKIVDWSYNSEKILGFYYWLIL